jgi:hypothetical protein
MFGKVLHQRVGKEIIFIMGYRQLFLKAQLMEILENILQVSE